MLGKAPTKNGEIGYIFIEINQKRIYLRHAQIKVNPMFKSGKLKNQRIDRMLSDSYVFLKTNIYLGFSWMAFKIPTTIDGKKVFFVLIF